MSFKHIIILIHYLKIEMFLFKLYLNWAKSLLVQRKSIHCSGFFLVCMSLKICYLLDFSFLKAQIKSMFNLPLLPPLKVLSTYTNQNWNILFGRLINVNSSLCDMPQLCWSIIFMEDVMLNQTRHSEHLWHLCLNFSMW